VAIPWPRRGSDAEVPNFGSVVSPWFDRRKSAWLAIGAQGREQHRISGTVQDVGDHASGDIESGDIGSGGRLGPDLRGCVDLPR
jgi:hypothetical protein